MNLSRWCPWSQAFLVMVFCILAAPEVAAAICPPPLPPVRIQLPPSGNPPLTLALRDFDCEIFTLSEFEPWLNVSPSSGGPGPTQVAFTFDINTEPGYYHGILEMTGSNPLILSQHLTV